MSGVRNMTYMIRKKFWIPKEEHTRDYHNHRDLTAWEFIARSDEEESEEDD
jgi:hypothetical protein